MTDLTLNANKYALAAIRERRAELSGEITSLESRLRHLRCSLVHVDATLRMFAPDADPEEIRAKKPYRRTKLFGAGKLNRLILGALRRGERPMTTAEVVDSIVAELGYGEDAKAGMRNRVRANLQYLSRVRGRVVKVGGTGRGDVGASVGAAAPAQLRTPRLRSGAGTASLAAVDHGRWQDAMGVCERGDAVAVGVRMGSVTKAGKRETARHLVAYCAMVTT